MAFIEALRAAYPQQDPDIVDVVHFLSVEDSLQTRDNLLRLFRLCCLGLISTTPELPGVKFGPVDTGDFHSGLVDLVRSARSYIVNVPGSCQYVTTQDAHRRLSSFDSALSDRILQSEYDPWTCVDAFGREDMLGRLQTARKAVSKSKDGFSRSGTGGPRSSPLEVVPPLSPLPP